MSLLKDLGQTDHNIPLEEAVKMVTRFRKELPVILKPEYATKNVLPFAETFNKSIFDKLAKLPGSVGIRSYLGMDESRNVKLIFVAVNDKNEDILPVEGGAIFEYGQRCPPVCATGPLNPQI